jgi:hypothetical protein
MLYSKISFLQQDPLFDGSTIYLGALNEAVCPGTFIFYHNHDEVDVVRIIMLPSPEEVKIIFSGLIFLMIKSLR